MSNPLLNLDNLTEPLTKLVEVVSKGMGTLYTPFGTVRQAKADANAKVIHAHADAEVLSIQQRAQNRREFIEERRQGNLESIAVEASRALPAVISKDVVDEDWIFRFFDCAQDVCDADMQTLWGRLLAGEVATPGTYSKRTLQFLKTMDKQEADAFAKYCQFAFHDSDGWYFVFGGGPVNDRVIEAFESLDFPSHFAQIGLVTHHLPTVHSLNDQNVTYFQESFKVSAPPKNPKGLDHVFNRATFTQIGQELRRVIDAKPIEGYAEAVSEYLQQEFRITLSATDL